MPDCTDLLSAYRFVLWASYLALATVTFVVFR